MAQDFSPTRFFIHVPNPLLAQFFREHHQTLLDFNFAVLEENAASAEQVFEAYKEIEDSKRMAIEGECREIEQMANHAGITALIKEANGFPHDDTGFSERMGQYEEVHGRAMWVFLEHPRYWLGHHVDSARPEHLGYLLASAKRPARPAISAGVNKLRRGIVSHPFSGIGTGFRG